VNKINWKLAPEGAIGVAQRGQQLAFVDNDINIFLDGHWGISMGWGLVAKRPTFAESITKTPQLEQTKTVADAVVAYPKWQEPHFMPTRENLEKIAKDAQGDFVEVEQEGEKWTHEYGCANIKCRILATDENECWVLTEYGNKVTEHIDELKPIKPTITKAEREKCAALAGYFNINPVEFDEYMEKYDSAEGPAND